MIVSKRDSSYSELQTGDVKINGATQDRKCDTDIQSDIGIAKHAFPKISEVFRDDKNIVRIKESEEILISYIYDSEETT